MPHEKRKTRCGWGGCGVDLEAGVGGFHKSDISIGNSYERAKLHFSRHPSDSILQNSLFTSFIMIKLLPSPWPNLGNLFLRVGIGFAMIVHGWPKILSGTAGWEHSGALFTAVMGFQFFPVVWGLLIALSQTLGGALIAIGFLTRPAALILALVMSVAAVMVFQNTGGNFKEWSHPAEAAIACFAIVMMGTGRFGWDNT